MTETLVLNVILQKIAVIMIRSRPERRQKKYKTRYSREWEKTYPFLKACPTSVSEKEYKFHCSCCNSNLSCVQGGMNDVAKHASKD